MESKHKSANTKKTSKAVASKQFYDKKKLLMEIVLIVFVLMMFGIAFYVYPLLPEKIPSHWNAVGEADGYSGRGSVFFIPIVFLVISILFFVLPLMEVFRENMLKIYTYYYLFKIIFATFFLVLFISTLLPNFGYEMNVSYVVIAMIGLLFIALGFILPKIKRNFMFGIRTGWTLSNDIVWDKTHKLGGILFGILGVLTLILLLILKLKVLFFIFLVLTIAVSLFLVLYSYHLYKRYA
jgi:uncharacterized membrane protein